jgi:hypothetical protein
MDDNTGRLIKDDDPGIFKKDGKGDFFGNQFSSRGLGNNEKNLVSLF